MIIRKDIEKSISLGKEREKKRQSKGKVKKTRNIKHSGANDPRI